MWTPASPDEAASRFLEAFRTARIFGTPSMLLALLYGIVWLVCWRGRPDRAARFRGAWLLLLAVLWGFTGLLGARVSWVVRDELPNLQLPLPLRPLGAFTVALGFLTLGVLRFRRGVSGSPARERAGGPSAAASGS